MTGERPLLAVVCGPTATGKTALGVELALSLGGEVVSADSMQVYRRMDIGTAKPTAAEKRGVPHHMLDVAEPWEAFSAARYVELATRCVEDILARGRLPIIVGGTGLYIDSLIRGADFSPKPDEALRAELCSDYDRLGGEAMLERLSRLDPERAALLHPNDKKRVVRALEVCIATGRTLTEHDEETKKTPPRYRAARVMLSFKDRARLYERIDRRVDAMLDAGLEKEVDALLAEGVSPMATSLQAIGYKELIRAKNSEISKESAVETIKRESRRYAKRQLTWFSRDASAKRILWENEPDFAFARLASTRFFADFGIE